jgi:hypothetical protein
MRLLTVAGQLGKDVPSGTLKSVLPTAGLSKEGDKS